MWGRWGRRSAVGGGGSILCSTSTWAVAWAADWWWMDGSTMGRARRSRVWPLTGGSNRGHDRIALLRLGCRWENPCGGGIGSARLAGPLGGRAEGRGSQAPGGGLGPGRRERAPDHRGSSPSADLGFALSHVVHLFHPEVIVMGGGLSLVGEPLRQAVETNLRGFVMEAFQPGPLLRLAELGEDAVPVGALLLAGREAG